MVKKRRIIKKEIKYMVKNFIGHTKKLKNNTIETQSLRDHLLNTQKYAEKYASDLSLEHVAGLAGILHDLGKYQSKFQEYIIESTRKGDQSKKGSIDHSSFGAIFLRDFISENFSEKENYYDFLDFGSILENAIFSHHNYLGLKDYINPDLMSPFLNRIEKFKDDEEKKRQLKKCKELFYKDVITEEKFTKYFQLAFNEYEAFISKIRNKVTLKTEQISNENEKNNKQVMLELQAKYFLSEYVYSCLLDADRTDATAFKLSKNPNFSDNTELFEKYYSKLVGKLHKLNKNDNSKINQLRAEISEECDQAAERPSGIYTLSASTGSGKTLASLRFGLKHAKLYHKKHIIYVLPYITIIEQNSEVIRKFLNDNKDDSQNILEFHSNVSQKVADKSEETTNALDLTEDSWDSPIIVTTMVQFLDSIFASGTKHRRRFHNLCDSIVIFDEVQKVPIKCLDMFNEAVNFLKNFGNTNVLLCTATQPALEEVKQKLDLNIDHEIIPNLIEHEQQFKRVEFIDKTQNDDGIDLVLNSIQAAELIFKKSQNFKSILGIFNTIDVTKKIYSNLKNKFDSISDQIKLEYLSTNMCPADRKERIKNVLNLVKEGKRVICISTPLIEAGVDASFECVFRSLSGLDSLVQAAGRCNRNNELKLGKVYLLNMDPSEEHIAKLNEVKTGKDQVLELLSEGIKADDFLNANVIKKYFEMFYSKLASTMSYPTNGINLENYIDGIKNVHELAYQSKRKDASKFEQLTQFSGSETIAKYFQVIKNNTKSVLAPYGDKGEKLIADLNGNQDINSLIMLVKDAQPYIVNLYDNKFNQLFEEGDIYTLCQLGNEVIYAFRPYAYNKLVLGDRKQIEKSIF